MLYTIKTLLKASLLFVRRVFDNDLLKQLGVEYNRKFAIHIYAWCTQWTNDTLNLIDNVKNLGMDFIEIPLLCLETFDVKSVKRRLGQVGLEAVT